MACVRARRQGGAVVRERMGGERPRSQYRAAGQPEPEHERRAKADGHEHEPESEPEHGREQRAARVGEDQHGHENRRRRHAQRA